MAKINNRYIQFYTPGSTAVKVAIQEEQHWLPIPEARPTKKTIIRVDPISVIGFAVAICMLILLAVGVAELNSARREVNALEHYIAQLTAENSELQETYSAGYELRDIEQKALNLGMVPAEEAVTSHIYITVPHAQVTEEATLWGRVTTYLTSLFA